jgi:hypothetical protein
MWRNTTVNLYSFYFISRRNYYCTFGLYDTKIALWKKKPQQATLFTIYIYIYTIYINMIITDNHEMEGTWIWDNKHETSKNFEENNL